MFSFLLPLVFVEMIAEQNTIVHWLGNKMHTDALVRIDNSP